MVIAYLYIDSPKEQDDESRLVCLGRKMAKIVLNCFDYSSQNSDVQ